MDISTLKQKLDAQGYVCDEALAATLLVALKLGRPLLIEGAAGVGKTEIAKVMAAALDRPLLRLQCYEGLDESKALYEWNYQKQLLSIQVQMDRTGPDALTKSLFSDAYLLERPLLQSLRAKTIPFVVLTSNRARPLSEALRRRCAYLYIPYPDLDKEVAILRSKLPNVNEHLAVQVAQAVHDLRENEGILKKPSIAETIDWVSALEALGISDLTEDARKRTLGFVLKSREDMEASGHCGACGHDGP